MFINRLLSYFSATLSSKLSTNLPYWGGGGWERVCVHKSSSKLHFCYFIQLVSFATVVWSRHGTRSFPAGPTIIRHLGGERGGCVFMNRL